MLAASAQGRSNAWTATKNIRDAKTRKAIGCG